jgi:hypothetical protein
MGRTAMNRWVVCKQGKGYLFKDSVQERLETNFDKDAVGLIKKPEVTISWYG